MTLLSNSLNLKFIKPGPATSIFSNSLASIFEIISFARSTGDLPADLGPRTPDQIEKDFSRIFPAKRGQAHG